jgi:dihydrofolate reductase
MVMGRRTFEVVKQAGGGGSTPDMKVFVFSHTLRQEDHPDVTIVDNPEGLMAELRSKPGKDVWLWDGGSLFRSFAELGLVDTVEVAVIPVLLGAGVPLLPGPAKRVTLKLTGHLRQRELCPLSMPSSTGEGRSAAGDRSLWRLSQKRYCQGNELAASF